MTHELEQIVIDSFKALDSMSLQSFYENLADDVETVDEITQKWNRGKAVVEQSLNALQGAVTDIKSELSDFSIIEVGGDGAVVTCLLNQSYVYEGQSVSIVAPTTNVFRKDAEGTWKFVLMHSIPFA